MDLILIIITKNLKIKLKVRQIPDAGMVINLIPIILLQIKTNLMTLNNKDVLSYTCGNQKSKMSLKSLIDEICISVFVELAPYGGFMEIYPSSLPISRHYQHSWVFSFCLTLHLSTFLLS
jgi:hypothetical protein